MHRAGDEAPVLKELPPHCPRHAQIFYDGLNNILYVIFTYKAEYSLRCSIYSIGKKSPDTWIKRNITKYGLKEDYKLEASM
jgi:hypothetical protein